MKAKLPKKQEQKLKQESDEEDEQEEEIEEEPTEEKEEDLTFIPRMIRKDALFVTFTGTIESGLFDEFKALYMHFEIQGGPDWKIISGKRKGMTQTGACDDRKIVWNYPFEISFETTNIVTWPQLIVAVYGTDFFGKPMVRGYGNVHLPTTSGRQSRKLRIFCPQSQSVLSGILGYFQGCVAEYRDFQKVLTLGEGREVTRTKPVGLISVEVETAKFNFGKFGYE